MVQLRHLHTDVFRVYVRLRELIGILVLQAVQRAKCLYAQVQLIPQLIINYKLKSVAHMPMKAMIYKTLSTVVDDLFAYANFLRMRNDAKRL